MLCIYRVKPVKLYWVFFNKGILELSFHKVLCNARQYTLEESNGVVVQSKEAFLRTIFFQDTNIMYCIASGYKISHAESIVRSNR